MPTFRIRPAAQTLQAQYAEVAACAPTPDGRFVLTGGWDGQLRLWEVMTGTPVAAVPTGDRPVSAVGVSPDGKRWVAGTIDGLLAAWDAVTHQRLWSFVAHGRPISAVQFSPDGALLATASWDRRVAIRDVARDRQGPTLAGHQDIVAGCRFTPDGRQLLSWSHDGTLGLWDLAGGRRLATLEGHTDRVLAAAVSPDGAWAASGARDGGLKLWDLVGRREAAAAHFGAEIKACFFLLDAASVVTADAGGRLRLHRLPELKLEAAFQTELPVECGDLLPTGGQLVLGCGDGRAHFVGIEGFDQSPLVVPAVPTIRRTASKLQRLLGRSRLVQLLAATCPACRSALELPAEGPRQPTPCPSCHRQLRVGVVLPVV